LSEDQTGSEGTIIFDPQERTIQMVNGFVQDQISIVPDYLALTLGAKAERNDFSGFEFQPSARLAYTPGRSQVLWTAVSRAVRTPTRLESDVRLLAAPSVPIVTLRGNPEFESEDLLAYELGYRIQPVAHLSAEISTFYNRYDNLRTVEPSTPIGPLILMNERSGDTYGFEAATRWQPTELWWLTASYSLVREDLDFAPGSQDPTGGTSDVNDPTHIAKLRSLLSLGHGIEFDQVLRYVDSLPNPHVPSYLELNLRLGWRPKPGLELSVVGANLLDSSHPEFSGGAGLQPEVQRSVYGKVAWIF
jgi:iron complex outermembrane receptor protein